MTISSSRKQYLLSLGAELRAQADRVRHLIGSSHWPTDGALKESLLIELLRRHLPYGVGASRGFVLGESEEVGCSRELDVLIADWRRCGPILAQADTVLAMASQAVAAVSVKSTLDSASVYDSVENLNSARSLVVSSRAARFWSGALFYSTKISAASAAASIAEALRKHASHRPESPPALAYPFGPHVFCTVDDFAFTVRYGDPDGGREKYVAEIHGYHCQGGGAAVLIADLLEHVAEALAGAPGDLPTILRDSLPVEPIDEAYRRIDL